MKKYFVVFLFFVAQVCPGQNLVNNWSFEDTVTCPDNISQIDRAVGWMSFSITPDYFNTCAPANAPFPVSVPHNLVGDQLAHTGNAYAGFTAFSINGSSVREFVATQLIQNLIPQEKYFLSFWVSTAFGYLLNQFPSMACNNIGAKFSTMAYSQATPQPVNNFAHILDTTIINDTTNWVKISGSFIADSAYAFLSIGNFYDNLHTTFVTNGSFINQAYYYLDDVKLSTDSDFVNNISEINSFYVIKLFPNPARDWIVIEGRNIESIEVFDLCGRMVLPKMAVSSFKTQVDISALSHGVYILKANTSTNTYINKFIHF
jgi:hypothetical protein